MSYDGPAISVSFGVSIDGTDLGTFNSCEGLGCEIEVETYSEGGANDLVWQFPTRVKYSNVTFSRPLSPETAKIAKWFARMSGPVETRTATIVAYDPGGRPMTSWGLLGVIPVRWTGPTLNLEGANIATETIEIAHRGFLVDEKAGA